MPPAREIARSRRGEGGAELLRGRHEHVIGSVHPAPEPLVVPIARDVQHGRSGVPVGLDREVVQAARPREGAEEGERRPLLGQAEASPPFGPGDAAVRLGHGPPGDPVLRAVASVDPVREEDAPRKRSREPVRQPEMSVGLGQRRRELAAPRGVDHRPGDVPAAAEHDVRPSPFQDRGAGTRRTAGGDQRPQERDRGTAREARDLERVELVARLGDEPSLDAIRRPGERHRDAALAQRLRHGERRQDVTRRASGGDQAPQLVVALGHRPRC